MAKRNGLGTSLLSRLMESDGSVPAAPHAWDLEAFPHTRGYNPRLVCMLVKNYRSHPTIIKLPSDMFYHGALENCADSHFVR
jgi:helicase MOV-10